MGTVARQGVRRRRRSDPRLHGRHRPQARHLPAHPLRHRGALRGLGFVHRHLDHPRHRGRPAEDLPQSIRLLRFGLLQLRQALQPGLPGLSRLRRHPGASPVLARRSRLRRQEDRRDRLRCHRGVDGARAGPQGGEGHHVAAFTGLPVLHAAGQPDLRRAAHGAAETGLLHHHSLSRPGLREGAVGDRTPFPERGARVRPPTERGPAAAGLSGRRRLQTELQPVGRTDVSGRRW